MPLEDAPGEEIHERIEELPHEELGGGEDARRLAGFGRRDAELAAAATEHRHVEGKDQTGFLECPPERLPGGIVQARLYPGDLQVGLAQAALAGEPVNLLRGC